MIKKQCITCKKAKYENIENFQFRGDTKKFRNQCIICARVNSRILDKEKYDIMPAHVKKAYIKRKSKQNSLRFKTKPEALKKKKLYEKTDNAIFYRYRQDCARRSKNIIFSLSLEEFKKLINSKCFYCGINNCRGVDRYNSNKSYTTKNSVPCCFICNRIKTDHDIKFMYRHIIKMMKNFHTNKNKILSFCE